MLRPSTHALILPRPKELPHNSGTQFLLIAKHPFLRYNGLKILGGNGREVDLPSG